MSKPALSISFRGLVDDALGIALWQADGSGPEPAATGHCYVTPIETITAHYYVASRDYIEPAAPGGMVATALVGAWPRVHAALAHGVGKLEDMIIRLPLTTAGADREGEDWFYRDNVETRYLRPQAPLPLLLGNEILLELAPSRLVLTEDYRGARQFTDVQIKLVSDPAPVRIAGGSGNGEIDALRNAFLEDLADHSVRFVVDAIHLTPETFGGHGRTSGRYAEIPTARLEVVETK